MNTALWIVQIILAIKLLTVTYNHALVQSLPTMQESMQNMGRLSRPLHFLAGVATLLAAVGLTLPGVLSLPGWVIPGCAFFAAFLLLISMFLHIRYRPKPKLFVSLVLIALVGFIIYGRLVLAP